MRYRASARRHEGARARARIASVSCIRPPLSRLQSRRVSPVSTHHVIEREWHVCEWAARVNDRETKYLEDDRCHRFFARIIADRISAGLSARLPPDD